MIAMGAAVAACAPSPVNVSGPAVARPMSHETPQNEADSDATDSDGDGVVDRNDACPAEPGQPSADARINGCPAPGKVELATMGELKILEQIHFAKGKSVIAAESAPLIEETIAALKTSPQIARLAVEGHASSDEPAGQRLSLERANAIVARIVSGGIDPARLVAKGFGATKPIDQNQSDDARMRNRRVEFRVLEKVETCADGGH